MAPGKYKDVAKSANDLLNSDYKFVKSLKLKSKSSNGFDFTCESKLGAAVSSSLSTKFSPAANVTVDKLQVNTDGRVVVESSLKNAVKGMTFKFAAEDGSSKGASGKEYTPQGSLSVDYCADKVTVNSKLDVVNGPTLSVSALTGHGGFVFGGTMTYNTQFDADGKSGAVTNYGGAVGYKTSDFTGSLLASKSAAFSTCPCSTPSTATSRSVPSRPTPKSQARQASPWAGATRSTTRPSSRASWARAATSP